MVTAVSLRYLSSEDIVSHQDDEALLKKNPNRWVMFPIHYDSLWDLYKEIENHFWAAEDFVLSNDRKGIQSLGQPLKDCISKLISYHILLDSDRKSRPAHLTTHLLATVQVPEARAFYGFQLSYENVHSEIIGLMSLEYNGHSMDQSGIPKIDWISEQFNGTACFFKRVMVQVLSKLVFRCSFGILRAYLAKENILPAYTTALETIERDIHIHIKFASSLLALLSSKMKREELLDLIHQAKQLEIGFCKAVLPLDYIQLKNDQLVAYVESALDQALISGGYDEEYQPQIDVEWLNKIDVFKSIPSRTQRPSSKQYLDTRDVETTKIKFDEDF